MIFCTHTPAAPLSAHVDRFWYFEGLEVPHSRERVLPDGSMELIINLDDRRRKLFDRECPERYQTFHRAWISGARSDYMLIDVLPQSSMIGAHFKPGGFAPFLSLPPGELAGQVVELDALLGAAANHLRDALLEASGATARFRILEDFLLGRIEQRVPAGVVIHALQEFDRDDSAVAVRRVAAGLGISHKHFIHLFQRETGLTPKRYCRVRRFQRTIAAIEADRHVNWSDTATAAGYFDQAHFANDLKEFSGLTPSEYLVRRNGELNLVPDDAPPSR